MPLIKCPDCGNTVSDKTITCLKCGRPIANTFEPLGASQVPVQTIEKTSKKLKGWMVIWVGVLALSLVVMMASGGGEEPGAMGITATLMFLVAAGGLVTVKFKVWWEHE